MFTKKLKTSDLTWSQTNYDLGQREYEVKKQLCILKSHQKAGADPRRRGDINVC